eukprot:CAMPEP_0203765666 /NCGR_PEP_ID=MMETSP0098-20131031/18536_1 /ASSEMBLY_ACC=CAM_ASM_000208 /TAXON_ID=96639 /ORGANISM=" , Strain NY0313808BC1" /LENGTH=1101 /DNA_ID=CAMNT_0050661939 /DNA_START=625 /DNA_END=3927 /DNA_ORIENTATION=-
MNNNSGFGGFGLPPNQQVNPNQGRFDPANRDGMPRQGGGEQSRRGFDMQQAGFSGGYQQDGSQGYEMPLFQEQPPRPPPGGFGPPGQYGRPPGDGNQHRESPFGNSFTSEPNAFGAPGRMQNMGGSLLFERSGPPPQGQLHHTAQPDMLPGLDNLGWSGGSLFGAESGNQWSNAPQPTMDNRQNNVRQGVMTMEELEKQMLQGSISVPAPSNNINSSYNQQAAPVEDGGRVSRLLSYGIALKSDENEPKAPVPPSEQQLEQDMDKAESAELAALKEEEKAAKRAARTARFMWKQCGEMSVTPMRTGPNQFIQVTWSLPADLVSPSSYGRDVDESQEICDWVGLFRARTRVDASDGFILGRKVHGKSRLDRRTGRVNGQMRLRTPRGVGQYNFRYFKGSTTDFNLLQNSSAYMHAGNNEKQQNDLTKTALLPLARSNTVCVEVQGADIFEALDFVQRNLSDRKKLSNATIQFATLLRQVITLRKPLKQNANSSRGGRDGRNKNNNNSNHSDHKAEDAQEKQLFRDLWNAVQSCISSVHKRCNDLKSMIEQEEPVVEEKRAKFKVLNDQHEKRREEAGEKGEDPSKTLMNEEDFAQWKQAKETMLNAERSYNQNIRDRATLSSSLRAVLVATLSCEAIQNRMTQSQRQQIEQILSLFCPVDEVFFASPHLLSQHYDEQFSMVFYESTHELRKFFEFDPSRFSMVKQAVLRLLENVIPPKAYEDARWKIVDQIQVSIVDKVAQSEWGCQARLVPFGSSVNNFGSIESDLDICLVLFPKGSTWPAAIHEDECTQQQGAPPAEKAVNDLAAALRDTPEFDQVDDSRKTARIPILQFRNLHPEEIECDICVDNRLAIRNTLLLRTYSMIDPRVRQMVYLVKVWSKKRDINNPAQRTLSSYGYILLILHFLQHLEVPILPPLQALPASWDGSPQTSNHEASEGETGPLVLVQSQDGKQHNTYFYGDPQSQTFAGKKNQQVVKNLLENFARRNKNSLGELLIKFFWNLAFGFDWRRYVIGIRDYQLVTKETKATEDSWKLHQRIAIEDPFETGYDVAHVVRDREFKLMRKEFVRAYAILSGCYNGANSHLANSPDRIIELLCEARAAKT